MAGQRGVAATRGVSFLDPTSLVCPGDPCPAIVDGLLVYRDADHLSPAFAVSLSDRLGVLLPIAVGP